MAGFAVHLFAHDGLAHLMGRGRSGLVGMVLGMVLPGEDWAGGERGQGGDDNRGATHGKSPLVEFHGQPVGGHQP